MKQSNVNMSCTPTDNQCQSYLHYVAAVSVLEDVARRGKGLLSDGGQLPVVVKRKERLVVRHDGCRVRGVALLPLARCGVRDDAAVVQVGVLDARPQDVTLACDEVVAPKGVEAHLRAHNDARLQRRPYGERVAEENEDNPRYGAVGLVKVDVAVEVVAVAAK